MDTIQTRELLIAVLSLTSSIAESKRDDGTFSRSDFRYDPTSDVYHCPADKTLTTTGTLVNDGTTLLYLARKRDCDNCELKTQCCPKVPFRKVPRHQHEAARDIARSLATTELFEQSRRERKKIEMRFAHLKTHHGFERLRLRGLTGGRVFGCPGFGVTASAAQASPTGNPPKRRN